MAENLKTQLYNNGELIGASEDNGYWHYGNDPNISNIYGKLYNWYAINDSRGVCPEGWHVPSNGEYQLLIDFLGLDAGVKLKSVDGWNGTNERGFNALPGGYRHPIGDDNYHQIGNGGFWWTSDIGASGTDAYRIELQNEDSNVLWNTSLLNTGYSVRCIQD